ncbi:MAG: hypothetical protein U9N83_13215 [Thermodesulfobacteriota bacterium]|nr:hypothetical protein [Thermodesulfobacteriota bacterium]
MKIDMSSHAVTKRLKMVNQLRCTCLSLADSSAGKKIRKQFSANTSVQRASYALGRCPYRRGRPEFRIVKGKGDIPANH